MIEERLERMRMVIVNLAIEEGLLTEEDYAKLGNKYIGELGENSLITILECAMHNKGMIFMTLNKKVLADREFLEKKFGVTIRSPEMMLKEIVKEEAEE